MNIIKRSFAVFLALVMMSLATVSSFAQEDYGIAPCYDNVDNCICDFNIYGANDAQVYVRYIGNSSNLSQVRMTVKIQKKVLLLFWDTIEIGEPNNEWIATSSNVNDSFNRTFSVSETGTYRAVFTVEFFGNNGSVDVIETKVESEYQ